MGRNSGRLRRSRYSVERVPELAPPRTAQDVRNALGQFMSDVCTRRLDPKVASTLGYLASILLKSIEVADLEGRLVALEKILEAGLARPQPRS